MSLSFTPWDPEGAPASHEPGRAQAPDPEPIVRAVRITFLFGGLMAAAMLNAGLQQRPAATGATLGAELAVTGIAAVVVLLALGWGGWAFRPKRLLQVGKRALETPDPRERQPRAEQARAAGFRGLAIGWALQAMVLGFLPVLVGIILHLMHGWVWELLAFTGLGLAAGFLLQHQITGAVRQAVEDPELRAHYGAG